MQTDDKKGLILLLVVLAVFAFGGDLLGPTVIGGNAPFKTDGRLCVLTIVEQDDTLPSEQDASIDATDSKSVRAWVLAQPKGEHLVIDVTDPPVKADQWVQDAYKVAKETKEFKTPWLIASNGSSGVNTPRPVNDEGTFALLKPLGK